MLPCLLLLLGQGIRLIPWGSWGLMLMRSRGVEALRPPMGGWGRWISGLLDSDPITVGRTKWRQCQGVFGIWGDTVANSKSTFLPRGELVSSLSLSLKLGSVFGALLSQKPRRDICQRGTSTTIQCEVDTQLPLMFWYRQLAGQGLILIATANQGTKATYESGFTEEKFPISRPTSTFSNLTVTNVSLQDSSFYFCSAGDTAPGTDQRSEQEPQPAPSCPAPSPVTRGPRRGRPHQLELWLWVWMSRLAAGREAAGPTTGGTTGSMVRIRFLPKRVGKYLVKTMGYSLPWVAGSEITFNYFISRLCLACFPSV